MAYFPSRFLANPVSNHFDYLPRSFFDSGNGSFWPVTTFGGRTYGCPFLPGSLTPALPRCLPKQDHGKVDITIHLRVFSCQRTRSPPIAEKQAVYQGVLRDKFSLAPYLMPRSVFACLWFKYGIKSDAILARNRNWSVSTIFCSDFDPLHTVQGNRNFTNIPVLPIRTVPAF